MKDESGDERRGYLARCGAYRSVCVFMGVNGFVGRGPGRSAEVSAASHRGSVGAGPALKLGFKMDLRSAFAASCRNDNQGPVKNRKHLALVNHPSGEF